ncbi:MAG: hypothetical protein HY698_11670, partial [Deltaproteobacteria bacterium]|nr:hypothetical protein [Deltaproteobacteria bacterium]
MSMNNDDPLGIGMGMDAGMGDLGSDTGSIGGSGGMGGTGGMGGGGEGGQDCEELLGDVPL